MDSSPFVGIRTKGFLEIVFADLNRPAQRQKHKVYIINTDVYRLNDSKEQISCRRYMNVL